MQITRHDVNIDFTNQSRSAIYLDFILSNEEADSVGNITEACSGLGGSLGNTVPGIDDILAALIGAEAQSIHDANSNGRGVGVNINYDLLPGPILTNFKVFSM